MPVVVLIVVLVPVVVIVVVPVPVVVSVSEVVPVVACANGGTSSSVSASSWQCQWWYY